MNLRDLFKIHSPEKKRLVENFFSLSVLQAANYILPLITMPYLVRVLGPDKFGLIAFSQAFIGYFMVLTDYGFNLSATRDISINRENTEKVSEIFNSVMIIKLGLLILSLAIMTVIVLVFEKFRKDGIIYYLTFGMVAGQVLFPTWFFQGMEKMKYITFLNILARLIFTAAIFVFVRESAHYIYVPLISSLGSIIAGMLALWIVFRDLGVKVKLSTSDAIKRELREGWHIFISTVAINFYKNNSILILGLFANNSVVGFFAIAKRLIDILNQIAGTISQTIYPYISRQININLQKTLIFIKNIGLMIGAYTFVFGIILLLFAPEIIFIVSGNHYEISILCLKLMSFVPMFIGVNVPAVQMLLGKGLYKNFTYAVLLGSILDIILNFLLVPTFSYIGSCVSVIVVELFVTMYLYYEVIKLKGKEI